MICLKTNPNDNTPKHKQIKNVYAIIIVKETGKYNGSYHAVIDQSYMKGGTLSRSECDNVYSKVTIASFWTLV